ncbi:MAG: hypothetical protein ACRD4L_11715 [Pyrinomonadaceae bacterium]
MRQEAAGREEEKILFMENKIEPYQLMTELLIEQKKPEEAFQIAEQSKGRVLLDILRNGRINIDRMMSNEERAQQEKLIGEIVSLNKELYKEKYREHSNKGRITEITVRLERARVNYEYFENELYAKYTKHSEAKDRHDKLQPVTRP